MVKKEKTAEQLRTEKELKKLKKRRNQIIEGCRYNHQRLDEYFNSFYNQYPSYRPKERPKAVVTSPTPVECSDKKFSTCEITKYDYPNGNRKTVNWEKMPKKNQR